MSNTTKQPPEAGMIYKIRNGVFDAGAPGHTGEVFAEPGPFSAVWYAVCPKTRKRFGAYGIECFTPTNDA
jgi:hypothetical protein